MFRLALVSILCSTSALAFAPSSLLPRQLSATSTSSSTPLPVSDQPLTVRFSTTSPETDAAATTVVELTPEYQAALDQAKATVQAVLEKANPALLEPLFHFCTEYITASQSSYMKYKDEGASPKAALQRILEGVQFGYKYGMLPDSKYTFGVTHDALRGNPETENGNTLDYYEWGCNFFRYFMDKEQSVVLGEDNLAKAMEQAKKGENVVFFANHQSEADPQVMSIMLEKAGYKKEAEEVIYVAGHKVTTDPLAIPFSMGRNLICIHSKKHIDADPETKGVKNRQNLAAMGGMLEKLKQGGCILWVAPSGGRDRRDVESGKTPIAPFDPKTVDMFKLMGRKSKVPTHYYPLAMVSYELCPPPDFVEAGVGEQRNFRFVPVGIKVGNEVTSDDFNPAAYEETLKDYYELREILFPGTAPEL
ncbi:glycerol-3-P acyltransferase [Nitzschia inconspicua]|uniref:Glycerol-3-P acyltransferase n=1 Tax=Nitzschia inconspicua TaxID=303405 RepID=A0A9K3L2M7_9STRA|nr:glycerol-3-P acyltransferase [Nitzschia inconspicua]